jgi:MYXO-CTERM domain-containing protein
MLPTRFAMVRGHGFAAWAARWGVVCASLGAGLVAPAAQALTPWRSARELTFSNGRAAASVDGTSGKVTRFLDHPYLAASSTQRTKNLRYDAFAGVRVGAESVWLSAVTPDVVGYDDGRGIVRVERSWRGLRVVERHFAPMAFDGRVVFTAVTVTRVSGAGAITVAGLLNDHVGSGPYATNGESVTRTTSGLVETGPSGYRLVHGALGAGQLMAAAGASAGNPYGAFLRGDSLGTALPQGAVDDAIVGVSAALGDLAVGASATVAWFTALADDGVTGEAYGERVRTFVGTRDAATLLADEQAAWDRWLTAAPATFDASERSTWRLQQSMLRMSQVREPGRGFGQIMASLDFGLQEGNWNVAWVRDMAYAAVALAETGHLTEARDSLAFVLNADSGKYVSDSRGNAYVGVPYQVSVCRYYGNGTEESDDDGTGPNIEFDGFGLYLWSLGRYLANGGDESFVRQAFPVIRDKVVAPLLHLQEASGLVAADSSIWERHWNGNQKHFAYTSIVGARGLCDAAGFATRLGEGASATAWRQAGVKMQDALVRELRDDRGFLAQSREELVAGRGYVDAAVLEAIAMGLVDPAKRTARATVNGLEAALRTASGMGIFRNDDGSGYDRAEWIVLDMRLATAQRMLGNSGRAEALESWVRGQADENFGLIAELHDERTGAYRGSVPMAGFGAGAWLLERIERGAPRPACGVYAAGDEALVGADAGDVPPAFDAGTADAGSPGGDAGGVGDAGAAGDAGGAPAPEGANAGGNEEACGCAVVGGGTSRLGHAVVALAGAVLAVVRRRRARKEVA